MNYRLLFVGGIHGAGKTTCCQEIVNGTEAQHFSAGQLISVAQKLDIKEKVVADVEGNQDALVLALQNLAEGPTILDGHFCLLNEDRAMSTVPLETFRALSPIGLAVLTVDPVEAGRRLGSRDGACTDVALLTELQRNELSWAKHIAAELKIPLLIADSFDELRCFSEDILFSNN